MLRFFLIPCLLFLANALFAQQIISGKVLADKNGNPIQGASIYINNSTRGTTSKADGSFTLQNDEWDNAEVIVSSVGYESVIFKVEKENLQKRNFLVRLNEKSEEMEAVLIITDEQRRKYLQIFRENFLGVTAEAAASKVTNLNAIYFIAGTGNAGSFTAKSDEPLKIVNKRLGYNVYFDLTAFTWDPVERTTAFFGYTRYESMGEDKKYLRHRAEAYYGSTMHFFRSLAKRDLESQGYSLMQIRSQQKMDVAYSITDSAVLKRNKLDSTVLNLGFPDRLQVTYKYENPGKKYLARNNIFMLGGPYAQSRFQINDSSVVYLTTEGGLINPENIMVSGYWSFEKAASLLPTNYVPNVEYAPREMRRK